MRPQNNQEPFEINEEKIHKHSCYRKQCRSFWNRSRPFCSALVVKRNQMYVSFGGNCDCKILVPIVVIFKRRSNCRNCSNVGPTPVIVVSWVQLSWLHSPIVIVET